MDITKIIKDLEGCPCGRPHTVNIKAVEIARGLKAKTAQILADNGFPRSILVVADKNTLGASDGILDILRDGGFSCKLKLYDDLREADIREVHVIEAECAGCDGILSIGTGSLNDICRVAALTCDLPFAIFATAPSMDGFASGTSPITENNFKMTRPAKQPEIIIADTDILAASPAELKSAGFGDILAKYIALVDWQVSRLTTGEYFCENVAELVRSVLRKVVSLADQVTEESPEAAEAIMEALVLTGLAMKLADCVRPASGTEHVISHYWEIKKLEKGLISDFHGKKVGVATLIAAQIYYAVIAQENIRFSGENLDWDDIYRTYGPNFTSDILKMNSPTVTTETTPEILRDNWDEIRRIVKKELPDPDTLYDIMKRAGAATTYEGISVDEELGDEGVLYHPYMRHRMTLMRLLPMTDFPLREFVGNRTLGRK